MDNTVKPRTVADFIRYLQTQPQHLPVAYQCCSEQVLLDFADIKVKKLQPPRPDGWIGHARPDREQVDYLLLPGN